ncbi:MAG: ABC transporter substrate-binding protein [Chloroflexi bacterium]|nr:ABC transporter substrate-binding protein [Chloroflexota bacterium]
MAIAIAPASLDPTLGSIPWNLQQLGMGETLTRVDRNSTVVPWLAQSVTATDDHDWEVVLRDGVTFFDGKPVDAVAVKKSLERSIAKDPDAASLLTPESITVTAPNTLVIRTKDPAPALMSTLAHYSLLIHDADAADADPSGLAQSPNLTGPFKPVSFKKDAEIRLQRNDRYWGDKAQVSDVDVLFVPDANARTEALMSNQVDLAYQPSPDGVAAIQQRSDLTVKAPTVAYQYFMVLNVNKPQFQDQAVRQALSLAIDRTALASSVLRGAAVPATGAFSTVFPFAMQTGYGFDPAQAKQKLDTAGWTTQPDGVRTHSGSRLAFTLITYPQRPELGAMAVAIQSELKDVGVQVDIRQVDDINSTLKDPSFDASMYAVNTAPTGDPSTLLNLFYKSGAPSNFGGFSSPTIDAEIAELNAASTGRTQLAEKIQQDLLDQAPDIYLVVPKFAVGLDARLKDYEPYPSDYYIIDSQLHLAS